MVEIARAVGNSAFIRLINECDALVEQWLLGYGNAIWLEDALIERGFFDVEFCDYGRLRAKYLNAVIPLGRWA